MKFVYALLLLLLVGFQMSCFFGFVSSDIQVGWSQKYAYWFLLLNFLLLGGYAVSAYRLLGLVQKLLWWFKANKSGVFVALALSLFHIQVNEFGYKILLDEHAIAASAKQLHETKCYQLPIQQHVVSDYSQTLAKTVDKRTPLFSFIVSICHDFFGYRFYTPVFINCGLLLVFLLMFYSIGCYLFGKLAGIIGVIFMGMLPMLGYVFVSGGLMPINLVMISFVMLLSIKFLKEEGTHHAYALLILSFALLVQARYESVLFFPLVLIPVIYSWWGKPLIKVFSMPTVLFFVCLLPRIWHHSVFKVDSASWQSDTEPFSTDYIMPNLIQFLGFAFSPLAEDPNSIVLSIFGFGGLVYVGLHLITAKPIFASAPKRLCFGAYALSSFFIMGLLLLYSWNIDDPVTIRLLMPIFSFLALLAGYGFETLYEQLNRVGRVSLIFCCGLLFWGVTMPKISRGVYAEMYPTSKAYNRLKEYIESDLKGTAYRTFVSDNPYFFYLMGENTSLVNSFNKKPKLVETYMDLPNAGEIFFVANLGYNYASKGYSYFKESEPLGAYYKTELVRTFRHMPNHIMVLAKIVGVKEVSDFNRSTFDQLTSEEKFRVLVP